MGFFCLKSGKRRVPLSARLVCRNIRGIRFVASRDAFSMPHEGQMVENKCSLYELLVGFIYTVRIKAVKNGGGLK